MINEKIRQLVDALDKKHQGYVEELHKHGGVNLEASKLGRDYKDLQREIIKVDIDQKKDT